jgi:hypothetical protein
LTEGLGDGFKLGEFEGDGDGFDVGDFEGEKVGKLEGS